MEYINNKLEEFNKFVFNKKIAIIGIGVSNIPLLDYFYERGSKVSVFDNKQTIEEEIKQKIEKYNFQLFLGENSLENLKGFDIIFRSPSAMPFKKEIAEEKERGAIVTTEIEMVIKLAPCKIIGITGTEGKTTTTTITYEILKKARKNVFLGGNIGKPIFTQVKDIKPEDIIVLEMSSFQLMDMDVSPNISLVTNIYPDHLNIHRSYEEYIEAKKNIFYHQKEDGILVLNYDNEITRKFSKDANGKVIFFSSKEKLEDGYIYDITDENIKLCVDGVRRHLINKKDIKLRGIHNYENICAALALTSSIVDIDTQIEAIKEFTGVEHRLEFVKEINGVKWYNDSIGTSPASTIAGLKSFDENIILIAGGSDNGLDYDEIGKVIAEKVGSLVLCGPTSEKIEMAVRKHLNKEINIYHVSNLKEQVKKAYEISKFGDVVLLSPASASFDAFKNFMERGEKFKEFVNEL